MAANLDNDGEASLRLLIAERPRNARAMAQLACMLAEQQKLSLPSLSTASAEALDWANRAVETAPLQPFGHTALSLILDDVPSRMKALQRAIDCSVNKPQHIVATIGLLVRRLVEPRQFERQQKGPSTTMAAAGQSLHPSVRPLSGEEEMACQQIEEKLPKIWKGEPVSEKEREFLALREYRLGMFFRKMTDDSSRMRCRLFFQATINHLPLDHVNVTLARFWLATLSNSSSGSIESSPPSSLSSISSCSLLSQNIEICPPEYIVGLYSTFAARFDELLVEKLSYRTPTLLRQLLSQTLPDRPMYQHAADLGCGTGLSGLAFASCIGESLVGVDLSPEMLAQARQRQCYHDLVTGDVTTILTEPQSYDLIFACDVFCYIGNLSTVFSRTFDSLQSGGIFCASTELLLVESGSDGDDTTPPYVLHSCARFAHQRSYIECLARSTGFDILATKTCPIRKNMGRDVAGLLVVLHKP